MSGNSEPTETVNSSGAADTQGVGGGTRFEDARTPTSNVPTPGDSSNWSFGLRGLNDLAEGLGKKFPEYFFILAFLGFVLVMSFGQNKLTYQNIAAYLAFVAMLSLVYGSLHYLVRKPGEFFVWRWPSGKFIVVSTSIVVGAAGTCLLLKIGMGI